MLKLFLIPLIFITMYSFADTDTEQIKKYKESCDLDKGTGCSYLGYMYVIGEGVQQDDFKAVEYFTKACEFDDGLGCASLGIMYKYGKGVRQSNTKALEYNGKACDLQYKKGCENYAKLNKMSDLNGKNTSVKW